ncbi:MAG TPA: alpha/beta hydrolase [Acidimicrobiales bacterium]|nr:alpha/beta hydrolase [Acidimicrobiales bacterium]
MDVAYESIGSGPPVLWVQGWSQPGKRWRGLAERFADRYTCVMPDNRECGATGPSPEPFTLTDLADDLLALMTRLGHQRFFVVGVSMGGMVSQELITRAPERVVAAVLVSTWGSSKDAVMAPDPTVVFPVGTTRYEIGWNLWSRLAGPGFAEAHPEVIHEQALINAEHEITLDSVLRQLDAIRQWDPGDALLRVDVPIAVVHGDTDPLIPYENGVRLAQRLGVELTTFPGVGHGVGFERPDELTALIEEFFEPYRSSSREWPSEASEVGPSGSSAAAASSA